MGMFDDIKCSADIGELTNRGCQTKDIYNVMSFFWIDPSGYMWTSDYSGTQDFHFVEGTEVWRSLRHVPNGNKGKVHRVYLTDYVTIYDTKTAPDGLTELVECRLHIVDGVLQSYKYK